MSINIQLMALRTQILGFESSIQKSETGVPLEVDINVRMTSISKRLEAFKDVPDHLRSSFNELKSHWEGVKEDFSSGKLVDQDFKTKVGGLREKVDNLYKKAIEPSISPSEAASAVPAAAEEEDALREYTDAILQGKWDEFSRDNPKTVKAIGSMIVNLREGVYGEKLKAALEESGPAVISQESILRLVLFEVAHQEEADKQLPESMEAFKTSQPEAFSALMEDLKSKDKDFLEKVLLGEPPLTSEETEIATALNRAVEELSFERESFQALLSNLQPVIMGSFAPTSHSVVVLIRFGLIDRAMELADSLTDEMEYVKAHTDLAYYYAIEVGDDDQAIGMFNKISEDPEDSVSTVAALISSRLSMEDPLRSILYAAQIRSHLVRTFRMSTAFFGLDREEVDRVIWYVEKFNLKEQIVPMVKNFYQCGETAKALTLLDQCWDKIPLMERGRFDLMAEFVRKEGMLPSAADVIGKLDTWRQIIKIVGKLKNPNAYNLWDLCCVKMANTLQLNENTDEALSYVKQIYSEKMKEDVVGRLLERILHSPKVDFDKVFNFVNALKPGIGRDNLLVTIANTAMMDFGDEKQARRAAEQISPGTVARYYVDRQLQAQFPSGKEPEPFEPMEIPFGPPPAPEEHRRGKMESLKARFKKLPRPGWRK